MSRTAILATIFLMSGLACYAAPEPGHAYKPPELTASVKAEIAKATQAIAVAPTAHNYCARGGIYGKNKHYTEALADHSRAIELNPNIAFYWGARGNDYANLGQWDNGIADANKAISLSKHGDPMYINALRVRWHCYYKSGRQRLADADANTLKAAGAPP